ncbi:MAG: response regulator, partial [Chitinophagaceae bacterium]
AGDADGMLEVLGRFLPDLIFMDIRLPGPSGFDCLARLAAHPIYCTIPVVMFSGSTDELDVARAYAGGAHLFFRKPAHFDFLVSGLRKVLFLDWLQPQRIRRRHRVGGRMTAFNPGRAF